VGENMENEENKSNEMSFEESLKELEAIVRRLEMGDVPLDDAIDEFHKAMILDSLPQQLI
jgi:exodeoxyribonuclease VII small subunit